MEESREAPKEAPNEPPKRPRRRLWAVLATLVGVSAVAVLLGVPFLGGLGKLTLLAVGLSLLCWFSIVALRRLLWRVGRRLAVSYLLVGVLPILMFAAQVLVGAYLLSGFFLGHLFRSHLWVLSAEVMASARGAVDRASIGGSSTADYISLVQYRNGLKVGAASEPGISLSPMEWPDWLARETELATPTTQGPLPFLVALEDGTLSLAAAFGDQARGTLAFVNRDVTLLLSERAQVWIEMVGQRDSGQRRGSSVSIGNSEWLLQPLQRTEAPEVVDAFYERLGSRSSFLVIGLETAGPMIDLATGEQLSDNVSATIFAPPWTVVRSLFSGSTEIDTLAWIAFIVPAFLLFDVYVVATLMAGFLIFGLSRAVNRLSSATNAVQEGDFSVRIPVRRSDQIGALQRSFNDMAANLESLVEEAAQKELLEKELQIATDVQKSLLPSDIPAGEEIEVATFFEPSAAIGGDYFDLVRLKEDRQRLAVVIADVSGHGIPAGLRMAMLKAAFGILVQEGRDAEGILNSLDEMLRERKDRGVFVTATLALIDLGNGTVEITNAGHPPTYLLRDGEVEEILLPSSPLGALGQSYGRRTVQLQSDDVMIWLSDGLIEATDGSGESFGFERTLEALRGDGGSAQRVRDRLIQTVRGYSQRRVAEDDQTMVVLRYTKKDASAEADS